jgi:diguanylate cyclase (GGDEF)-like protein
VFNPFDNNKQSRRLGAAFWVVLTVSLLATVLLAQRSLSRVAQAQEAQVQSLMVDKAVKGVMAQLLDVEASQRGYLLSGRASSLQPYYTALTRMREARLALASALQEEPAAKDSLELLFATMETRLQELDRTVRLKSEGRVDEAMDFAPTDLGNKTMDMVREQVQALKTDHGVRNTQDRAEHERDISGGQLLLGASLVINALLLLVLFQRVRTALVAGHAYRLETDGRNAELAVSLESAVASIEHVKGLSELSRFLQSCSDMDEAAGPLKQHLPPLMRANSGALYLMATSENQLCQVFTWGDGSYTEVFEPHDCWAVRLGQTFHQPREAGSASCAHLQSEHVDATVNVQCLPLVAHGELMGVLVLDAYMERDQHTNLEIEGTRRFALEQVSLSIGNLKLRESLRQQSIRDVLTGLYNRRFFEESSQREVLRASRLQAQGGYDGLALMMIDIDHFKMFNDQHGHEVGDHVLREVAQVLQSQTRGSDVAARFGGEEFTIVMADITAVQALERAQRVRKAVESLVLRPSGKDVGGVTISIGLAQFPTHGITVEALLLSADKALYEAKHAGRNRVVVAT